MTESQQPPAPTGFPPVTEARLREVAQCIVEAFDPERIILFGSYASGEPTSDSDVDLLIVMENGERRAKRRMAISQLFRPRPCPMDILVYTPSEIQQALTIEDPFILKVMREGQTLYARAR